MLGAGTEDDDGEGEDISAEWRRKDLVTESESKQSWKAEESLGMMERKTKNLKRLEGTALKKINRHL
uniref:Uncharacterized protein n=1 Tax=Nothobranchius kadleci TaxID=1051664 RepID=A0A1A8C052_NOTKA